MATLGERIRLLREEKRLSQEELGKIFSLSQSAIAYYETNRKDPSSETLRKMADFFNVTLDFLLGRSDVRNPCEILAAHRIDDPMDELPGMRRITLTYC